jgi:hypothetical protein
MRRLSEIFEAAAKHLEEAAARGIYVGCCGAISGAAIDKKSPGSESERAQYYTAIRFFSALYRPADKVQGEYWFSGKPDAQSVITRIAALKDAAKLAKQREAE